MNLPYRPLALMLCACLAACGSTDMKETLGLNRKAPDEFQVYARPPLAVPPEFNLRPPGGGAGTSSGNLPADAQAHSKILSAGAGADVPVPGGAGAGADASSPLTGPAETAVPAVSASELPSTADSQFLSDAGAVKSDPHVRQQLQDDGINGVGPKDSTYLFGAKKTEDSMVDPNGEAARLKQDKAQNKPPTDGETPVVPPEDKGILGDIF